MCLCEYNEQDKNNYPNRFTLGLERKYMGLFMLT